MQSFGRKRDQSHRFQNLNYKNNLKQIGLALHNYHDDYGSFPPAYVADEQGKPMHSWRVLLLPYVDHKWLYDQYRFDEPWDGPNNRKLHYISMDAYACPSSSKALGRKPRTDYMAVVGEETAWPGSESVTIPDIQDGTAETIMGRCPFCRIACAV